MLDLSCRNEKRNWMIIKAFLIFLFFSYREFILENTKRVQGEFNKVVSVTFKKAGKKQIYTTVVRKQKPNSFNLSKSCISEDLRLHSWDDTCI